MKWRYPVATLIGAALVASAHADVQDTEQIVEAAKYIDIPALEQLAETSPNGAERSLAKGVAASFLLQDAAAEESLKAAIASNQLSKPDRSLAHSTLAGLCLRQTRFTCTVQQLDRKREVLGGTLEGGDERTYRFASALASTQAMRWTVPPSGMVAMQRDRANLLRAPLLVNGIATVAVVDTGASYSTISETLASRLGIEMLPARTMVGSATGEVEARLGIARRLSLADASFENVVFIVLPDSALTFAGGLYKIDAIVGLPILLRLGRLEFSSERSTLQLRYESGSHLPRRDANLFLSGVQPVVQVRVNGELLRMLLDSGARSSMVFRSTLTRHPGLARGTEERAMTVIGAGGAVRDDTAVRLTNVAVAVGGQTVKLVQLSILDRERGGVDGVLGQDVLFSGTGYVADFRGMRIEVRQQRAR